MNFDVILIGAGPWRHFVPPDELTRLCPDLRRRNVLESGHPLENAPLPHRRRKGQNLHRLQDLLHHERLRRRGRILRRKI